MSIFENISDSGGSAFIASDIMSLLDLNQYDLEDPVRFERFKDVVARFKDDRNYSYIIKKVTLNKNVNKLDHVFGYISLTKQAKQLEEMCKQVDDDMSTLIRFSSEKGTDPNEMQDYKAISNKRNDLHAEKTKLEAEIKLYE